MTERECVALLEWALPRLGLRWRGFKGLHRQVCRRIVARARELGIGSADEYRARLEADAGERARFEALCFVTISRFYRDAAVFEDLRAKHLPRLAEAALRRGERTLRIWSAGCASGEEPYTLAILWHVDLAARFPRVTLDVLATDRDETVLRRAAEATYEPSSLRELPNDLVDRAFIVGRVGPHAWLAGVSEPPNVDRHDGAISVSRARSRVTLRPEVRAYVRFEARDVRSFAPSDPLDLVLCRNVVFTYFDEASQRAFVERLPLAPGGVLVLGKNERLPGGCVPHIGTYVIQP